MQLVELSLSKRADTLLIFCEAIFLTTVKTMRMVKLSNCNKLFNMALRIVCNICIDKVCNT